MVHICSILPNFSQHGYLIWHFYKQMCESSTCSYLHQHLVLSHWCFSFLSLFSPSSLLRADPLMRLLIQRYSHESGGAPWTHMGPQSWQAHMHPYTSLYLTPCLIPNIHLNKYLHFGLWAFIYFSDIFFTWAAPLINTA